MTDIPCLLDNGTKDFLRHIADKIRPESTIVEIGSFLGGSICHLATKIDKNIQTNIFCIDTWTFDNISDGHLTLCTPKEEKSYRTQFLENVAKYNIYLTAIQMDSILAAQHFNDKSVDFLFVDGNHTYPHTKEELLAWLPKMKENSVILGHDFSSSPDIQKAVHDVLNDNVGFTENKDSYIYTIGKGL